MTKNEMYTPCSASDVCQDTPRATGFSLIDTAQALTNITSC